MPPRCWSEGVWSTEGHHHHHGALEGKKPIGLTQDDASRCNKIRSTGLGIQGPPAKVCLRTFNAKQTEKCFSSPSVHHVLYRPSLVRFRCRCRCRFISPSSPFTRTINWLLHSLFRFVPNIAPLRRPSNTVALFLDHTRPPGIPTNRHRLSLQPGGSKVHCSG